MDKIDYSLIKGETYLIDGIEMTYLDSEGSKHYFSKTGEGGILKGRRRIIRGSESSILKILCRKHRQ
jgi:hypothetical protein